MSTSYGTMGIFKEKKERLFLEAAHEGLKNLLRSSEPLGANEFLPLKTSRAGLKSISRTGWVEGYMIPLFKGGLISANKTREGQIESVSLLDRKGVEALVRAHENGESTLSDIVFASDIGEQTEDWREQQRESDLIRLLVDTFGDFGRKVAESVDNLRMDIKHIAEDIQGTNKRVNALERQLEAALGALNGVIRTVQQVDSVKLLGAISDGVKDQKVRHDIVLEQLREIGGEVLAVSHAARTIATGLKAHESDKLGRALRDLQAVIGLLVEAKEENPDA